MAKPKLCEIIAVVSGKKGETEKAVTDAYHSLQKADLFSGFSKTYRPFKEDGERLPPEEKQPQLHLGAVLAASVAKWVELFDLTLTLDAGNCDAKADLVVDGQTVAAGVPVTTLLFLAKQLENVKAYIEKMPTPPPAERWSYDSDQDMLVAAPRTTVRTKKEQKPIVLFPATKEHPAQTQLVTEDVPAGEWTQVLFTTCLPAAEKNAMLERVGKLLDAVKAARERANAAEVDKLRMGASVLGYVFGPRAKISK